MMIGGLTSTNTLIAPATQAITTIKKQLGDAESELGSGVQANLEVSLGANAAQDLDWRAESASLTSRVDANNTTLSHLSGAQTALSSVASSAQSLLTALLGSSSGQTDPTVLQSTASSSLQAIEQALNTSFGGVYIFGGTNATTAPLASYVSTPQSAAQTSVAAAFQSAFGTSQNSSAANSISASSMQSFLTGAYQSLFTDPAWGQNWSAAGTSVTAEIGPGQTVTAGTTSNDQSIRDIISGVVMIADLGLSGLNQSASQAVMSAATTTLSSGLSELTNTQANLGLSQSTISSTNDQMTASSQMLTQLVSSSEGVDTGQIAVNISTLTTNLNAAYEVVSNLQKLSLMNYMSVPSG